MCRALVEGILGVAPVHGRIGDLAVGLAADCDDPDSDVAGIMDANLAGATSLPFVAILTHEGEWVTGYSGGVSRVQFAEMLDKVEKLGKLDAPPELRKRLAKLATEAQKAAEKQDWRAVLKAAKTADDTFGRCEERDLIVAATKKARDWAEAQFASVFEAAAKGADLTPEIKRLRTLAGAFAREPEADAAKLGIKALGRLNRIRAVETRGGAATDLRSRTAKEFQGSRWTKLFVPDDQKK